MPLEPSFNFIDDLDPANPVAGDNVSQGDDHLRGIKNAIQGSFTSLGSAAVTATAAELNITDGLTRTTAQLNGTLESIDEDDMVSDSDTHVPTQQSVKAYIDGQVQYGRANTAGTMSDSNTAWTATNPGTGIIRVTHNLGNSGYNVTATADNGAIIVHVVRSTNSFDLSLSDHTGSAVSSGAVNFQLIKNF